MTLDSAGNQETVYASDTTAVAVESSSVTFCTLEGYVGAPAAASVVPYGNEFLATQIAVTGPVAVVPATTAAIVPLPIVGSVLGTVLVDGLLYLLTHAGDGAYYRYPYYGAYYRHYYSARYRRYRGYYPASAPVVSVAEALSGVVLGIVTVDQYQYLAVRDRDGQLRRYPYYGPYRPYYYRPAYRPYAGAYVNISIRAPVAQGDPHWDAPRYAMERISQTVTAATSISTAAAAARLPAAPDGHRREGLRQDRMEMKRNGAGWRPTLISSSPART